MSDTAHSPDDCPFDLGIPTELESYQHQCLMLLDELHEAWADIRKLKGDTRTLVAMNDALTAELKALKAAQRRAHQTGNRYAYGLTSLGQVAMAQKPWQPQMLVPRKVSSLDLRPRRPSFDTHSRGKANWRQHQQSHGSTPRYPNRPLLRMLDRSSSVIWARP